MVRGGQQRGGGQGTTGRRPGTSLSLGGLPPCGTPRYGGRDVARPGRLAARQASLLVPFYAVAGRERNYPGCGEFTTWAIGVEGFHVTREYLPFLGPRRLC